MKNKTKQKNLANLDYLKWFPYRLTSVLIVLPRMGDLVQGTSLKEKGAESHRLTIQHLCIHSDSEERSQRCRNRPKQGIMEQAISKAASLR